MADPGPLAISRRRVSEHRCPLPPTRTTTRAIWSTTRRRDDLGFEGSQAPETAASSSTPHYTCRRANTRRAFLGAQHQGTESVWSGNNPPTTTFAGDPGRCAPHGAHHFFPEPAPMAVGARLAAIDAPNATWTTRSRSPELVHFRQRAVPCGGARPSVAVFASKNSETHPVPQRFSVLRDRRARGPACRSS